MLNTISVDVEEYFHAANLEHLVPPAKWHTMPSRVISSTRRVLELFAESNTIGTFFILGSVARRHPDLVREIVSCGHEIASHGYGHRLAYTQSIKAFTRDITRTKRLLEDLSGVPVYGYRAPNFSIIAKNDWAYDVLIEAGYRYDSSLYPVRHPRYSNNSRPRTPTILERQGGAIFILPLACVPLSLFGFEYRLPIAGGAYWRLFPRSLISWGVERLQRESGMMCNCYFHPWELDVEQPRVEGLSLLTKIRHYGGMSRLPETVQCLLRRAEFKPMWTAAREYFVNSS